MTEATNTGHDRPIPTKPKYEGNVDFDPILANLASLEKSLRKAKYHKKANIVRDAHHALRHLLAMPVIVQGETNCRNTVRLINKMDWPLLYQQYRVINNGDYRKTTPYVTGRMTGIRNLLDGMLHAAVDDGMVEDWAHLTHPEKYDKYTEAKRED